MPTLPPDCEAICELTPITRPLASSSGPPELPGLIGASVWITESIWKPSGAWMWRPVPETIPAVVVCESPNGEPIATASWPVRTALESASESALSLRDGLDLHDRQVADERSTPLTCAGRGLVVGELHLHGRRVADHVRVGDDRAVGVDDEARARAVVGLDRHDGLARRGVDRGDVAGLLGADERGRRPAPRRRSSSITPSANAPPPTSTRRRARRRARSGSARRSGAGAGARRRRGGGAGGSGVCGRARRPSVGSPSSQSKGSVIVPRAWRADRQIRIRSTTITPSVGPS